MQILLINGPNLNLLGSREPSIYGAQTLSQIELALKKRAELEGIELNCFQSNSEGDLVDRVHQAIGKVDGILINAGAFTHTSVALRDALGGSEIPFVEIHLSNISSRENFRHNSYLADLAIGIVSGFKAFSYNLAFQGLVDYLSANSKGK